ncbi:adenylosuccinate lyase [Candidatus Micrarchaeota archaeon]|nr:adenylosuccinate lyase [Candidatus Micrarchaeota archaeon]
MVVSPLDSRYKTEMNAVFDEENKLRKWLEVEVALARAHAKAGSVPLKAADEIARAVEKVKLKRVQEIEEEIHHDLMAMVKGLSEQSGSSGKFVHLGATSYDIEDTATALVLREAVSVAEQKLFHLRDVLVCLAKQKKGLVCVARTHGQHAVPTTYGLKFAVWAREVERHLQRIEEAKKRLFVGKMSGAAGTMASFGEKAFEIQDEVMRQLKLEPALATTQVIQRDRHAEALMLLALVAATLEKIAKEIRNLQRNEVLEVAESFGKKQVGSSTMPQKRNPHKSERVCSLARVVRANVQTALENIALEHERDLTNSANERFIIPESFIVTDYMLSEVIKILEGLEFFPENIERNLKSGGGAILSERIMIALVGKGLGRQEAHELMRTINMEAFEKKKTLKTVISENSKVNKLFKGKELQELLDEKTYVGKAKEIVEML